MNAAAQRSPLRVLIVEDYEDAATSLAAILTIDQHEVYVARTGPAAIETAKSHWPDAVLLDLGLPGCNGYHVAKCIREDGDGKPNPLFIVISGYATMADRLRSETEGIYIHLPKPADLELLRGLLHDLAARDRRHFR
jgi:CheY-like chemotaxis protein